ncbi:hypothetical protein AAG906_000678 [Vitis piasezkii]
MTLSSIMLREKPHAMVSSVDEVFSVPGLPWVNLTTNDFEPPFSELEPKGAHFDFVAETGAAAFKSYGMLVNSFYDLEPRFNDYWNQKIGPRAWCVGPLCLAEPPRVQTLQKPTWVQWLDEKLAQGSRCCMWPSDLRRRWHLSSCMKLRWAWKDQRWHFCGF